MQDVREVSVVTTVGLNRADEGVVCSKESDRLSSERYMEAC